VHLVVGDIHFGKGSGSDERAKEKALVACLDSFDGDVQHLVLIGDVFEYYIEYRHLIPKGFTRFLGLLAAWADEGRSITYVAGNHDPWHRDYFASEFGARVVSGSAVVPIYGRTTYLHHGDGIASKSVLYNRIRSILRHPVPVWMYRTLIPGDAGAGLAKYVSRRFGEEEVDERVAEDLRRYARRLMSEQSVDQVIFGHSHVPEISDFPEGTYLNPGAWHETRTVLRLNSEGAAILRWNDEGHVAYQAVAG
jgi:UDP-2,3-diacylglucosamine hydrolase